MDQLAEAGTVHSAEWWQSRTNSQLHELLRGGLVVDDGAAAHRELERRARELERAADDEAERRRQYNKALRLRILGVLLLAALIALAATMLVGRAGLSAELS